MLASLYALILALLSFLGPVRISLVPGGEVTAYDPAHQNESNPLGAYSAVAKASCPAGDPHLYFTTTSITDPNAVAHELLHAADCADNGVFDGSPDPTACAELPTDCLHSWVYWAMRNQHTAVNHIRQLEPQYVPFIGAVGTPNTIDDDGVRPLR